jgi:hypothetical protein
MYRVLILLFLAIGSLTFAVDSSDTILQAKSIADTSVTLQWSPIEGADHYKVFYDDSQLLKSDGSKPLFNSDAVKQPEIQIRELTPSTEYTFLAHAFDRDNKEIAISLPVHIKTFSTSSFAVSGDPVVVDAKTLQISFTRPIDIRKTQIIITHSQTKKQISTGPISHSPEDLRVISIPLHRDLEIGAAYDILLKKVFTQAGTELAAENKIAMKIAYNGDINSSAIITPPAPENPETTDLIEPVPIDQLPQT